MIAHSFTARLLRTEGRFCNLPVPTELRFDVEHDPLAVQVVFYLSSEETTTWYFARDLLVTATNTTQPTGDGDVKFRTEGSLFFVCLNSPEGHADLGFPVSRVREFLGATTEEAASCGTVLDAAVDRFLEEVMSGEQ